MSQDVQEKLKEFLEAYGWVYRFDGQNIFYSGWRSINRSYSLRVQLNESLLFFEVNLLSLSDLVQEKHWKSILEFILRLNRKISTVKLGLDDEECIVLLAETFTDQLTYDYLSKLLGIIGYYAEKLQEEVIARIHELNAENQRTHRYLI
jgi:hypothetical protein